MFSLEVFQMKPSALFLFTPSLHSIKCSAGSLLAACPIGAVWRGKHFSFYAQRGLTLNHKKKEKATVAKKKKGRWRHTQSESAKLKASQVR